MSVEVGKEVLLLVCTAGRRTMAWCRIQLTEDERRIVNEGSRYPISISWFATGY